LHKLFKLSLSKSAGPDSFHPRVLFEIRLARDIRAFTKVIYHILLLRKASGRLAICKYNIAVYKEGNKKDPSK